LVVQRGGLAEIGLRLYDSVRQRYQRLTAMKLEIARSLFLVAGLGIASLALTVWEQPRPKILSAQQGEGQCPLPRVALVAKVQETKTPDQDLLLLMYGLVQGMRQ
jgi:hypothetical protein